MLLSKPFAVYVQAAMNQLSINYVSGSQRDDITATLILVTFERIFSLQTNV
jgi:hypothetical protein